MKFSLSIRSLVVLCLASLKISTASVFLPSTSQTVASPRSFAVCPQRRLVSSQTTDYRHLLRNRRRSSSTRATAMAIPGYGIAEQVFVGGFGNFLSIYNLLITGRILLSWFPQAQGVGALQPLYQITDPFLNLFRGVVPPIFGLDISPLFAFFLLNVVTQATAAVGCDLPVDELEALRRSRNVSPFAVQQQRPVLQLGKRNHKLLMNL